MRTTMPGAGFYAALRQHLPATTLHLLLANIAVFLAMVLLPPVGNLLLNWGLALPTAVVRGQVWRLVSYMFLHADAGHLLFNMLTLYFFGPTLERHLGTRRFTVYYAACGVGAALVHLVWCYATGNPEQRMLGASGALYGVLVGCAYYFPNTTVYLNLLFPIKMKYLVWIFGTIAFLGSVGSSGSGVSHVTHLGGLATGLVLLYGPRFLDRFGGPRGPFGGGGKRRRRTRDGRIVDLYDDPHWRLDQ